MTREQLFSLAAEQYAAEAEFPWGDDNAVLRRPDNRKWFGVILRVAGDKLGRNDTEWVELLNVKCDPAMIGALRPEPGFFPAYHMNKDKWISILLGDPKLDRDIEELLALSYELTANKIRKKNRDKNQIK